MLNKLRKKLALFNGVILVFFVIVVVSCIWLLADKGLIDFWDKDLKGLAYQIEDLNKLPVLPDFTKEGPFREKHDFVKIILRDNTMLVTAVSPGGERLASQTRAIAQKSWQNNKESWTSIISQTQYVRVYSVPFHKNSQHGIVQTTVDLHVIHFFMTTFMTHLMVSGLIFAIIAAMIGWFLAGKALIPVKRSWQQQEEFVANAAHEIRTPLTVIQTNLDVVLSSPDTKIAENMKWLDNAYTETEHMGRLISDLLLLAQVDGSEIKLDNKAFDLSALLIEISIQMEPVAQNQDLLFLWEIDPGMILKGDKWRIRQLFMILLDNSFKYTPPGGNVKITARRSRDKIEILVQDSGIGISKEDRERIFERFYRADKARSRTQSGTGLGLSIAQWIIHVHRGSILLQSELGSGSCFTVILPLN